MGPSGCVSRLWYDWPHEHPGGSPHHHGSLLERLVAHAVRLLDEAGAEVVTVREVARRAGVSPEARSDIFPTGRPCRPRSGRRSRWTSVRPLRKRGHRAITRSVIELIVAGAAAWRTTTGRSS
ncbi:TetR family transcriptional regulator [Streptomyces anulatus]